MITPPTHHPRDYDEFSEQEGERQHFGTWLSQNAGIMAVLMAIFVQTTGAVWWASSVSTQISGQQDINRLAAENMRTLTSLVEMNSERLAKVETVQANVVKVLDMISERQIRSGSGDGPARGPEIPPR